MNQAQCNAYVPQVTTMMVPTYPVLLVTLNVKNAQMVDQPNVHHAEYFLKD